MSSDAILSDSQALLAQVLRALADKKGRDLIVFDMRGHSDLTDYCVLATGLNGPHLKALANELRVRLKGPGRGPVRRSSTPESGWLVADAVDVVAHVFTPEMRSYYGLDELWAKIPRVPVEPLLEPESGADAAVKPKSD